MLKDVINYSGLFAKTKALESRLLSESDYFELASQKDVHGFAQKLFENRKFEEYTDRSMEVITSGRFPFEKNIVESMYVNFFSLFRFLTDTDAKKYLNVLFLKYEIGILKGMLRNIFDQRNATLATPSYLKYFSNKMNHDIMMLSKATSLEEFVKQLETTNFHSVLKNINLEDPSLFEFENQLDLYYYCETWRSQNRFLSGQTKQSQMRINGTDIDLHNVMYIYRLKKFYNIQDEMIYTYLIPINYKLKRNVIGRLVGSQTDTEFKEILSTTVYRDVFAKCDPHEMEIAFYRYLLKVESEEERKHPYSINSLTSYFVKKGQEIRNLVTLIECVRYGLDPETAMTKLNILPQRGEQQNG